MSSSSYNHHHHLPLHHSLTSGKPFPGNLSLPSPVFSSRHSERGSHSASSSISSTSSSSSWPWDESSAPSTPFTPAAAAPRPILSHLLEASMSRVVSLNQRSAEMSVLGSPLNLGWSPFLGQADGFEFAKPMDASSAMSRLYFDDLSIGGANHEICSPGSSDGSSAAGASGLLAPLPAWSTSEVDSLVKEEAASDLWAKAASGKTLRRSAKKHGEASADLAAEACGSSEQGPSQSIRMAASAPQLGELEGARDFLQGLAWDSTQASGSGNATAGPSSASLVASTSAHTLDAAGPSSLYQRRAEARNGEMPQPTPVAVPSRNDDKDGKKDAAGPHSRSATFPGASDGVSDQQRQRLAQLQAMQAMQQTAARLGIFQDFVAPSQQFAGHEASEKAARAVQAALLYGMEGNEPNASPGGVRRPSVSSAGLSSASTNDSFLPPTPLHPLAPASAPLDGGMFPHSTSMGGGASSFDETLFGYTSSYPDLSKAELPGGRRYSNSLSNALGLSMVPPQPPHHQGQMDPAALMAPNWQEQQQWIMQQQQLPQQQQNQFRMVQPSGMPMPPRTPKPSTVPLPTKALPASPIRTPKTSKSSPNLKSPATPSSSGPRKIASNKRLAATFAAQGGDACPPVPPIPAAYASSSSGSAMGTPKASARASPSLAKTSRVSMGGFSFVNYGIHDADELCSAVAPSGSYKIPLKGFGGDSADGSEEGGRGSSAARLGPRWEERTMPAGSSNRAGSETSDRSRSPNVDSTSEAEPGSPGGRAIKKRKSAAALNSRASRASLRA